MTLLCEVYALRRVGEIEPQSKVCPNYKMSAASFGGIGRLKNFFNYFLLFLSQSQCHKPLVSRFNVKSWCVLLSVKI